MFIYMYIIIFKFIIVKDLKEIVVLNAQKEAMTIQKICVKGARVPVRLVHVI